MNAGRLLLIPLSTLLVSGCDRSGQAPTAVTLATTTSTRDSGLLDVLIPMFESETGIEVKVVAVGTELLLGQILPTVESAGIPRNQILVLIATGLHRPNEGDELVEAVKKAVG